MIGIGPPQCQLHAVQLHGCAPIPGRRLDWAATSRRCVRHSRRAASAVLETEVTQQRLADVVTVREAASNAELEQASRIRAHAYYQEQSPVPRFAVSLAKQMASDEYRALLKRTSVSGHAQRPECLCLVAVIPDSQQQPVVLGSLDLRLPGEATGQQPRGVPENDPGGAFLVNVAVDEPYRGMGVGRKLIKAAVDTAARRLMAKRLYTHMDCDNDAAWRLYQQQGFDVFDDAACELPGGRLVLVAHLSVK